MEKKRCRVLIHGLVQGVGFRNFTQQQAQRLCVEGWVRNLDDGRVEAVFEGSAEAVDDLLERVTRGPRLSKVSHIEVSEDTSTEELSGFLLRR